MHVDLISFFPSCEELRDPTLKGKPHVVIMTDETKDKITRGAVAPCSYEARRYGVRSVRRICCQNQRRNKAAMWTVIIYRSSFYKINCENSF